MFTLRLSLLLLIEYLFYTLNDNETQIHGISSARQLQLKKYTGNTPQNVCEEVDYHLQTPAHRDHSSINQQVDLL